ncbi:MAG: amidohydrolase [Candidatus Cloacimonetes bacterium]|nr:amidohydrolase [Candidatus Cloacimonadota bacterium]
MQNLINLRHEFHQIPEIAFEEYRTKALVIKTLHQILGHELHSDAIWKIQQFTTSNAILVEYRGGKGSFRLFRADMDALPVSENSGCKFPSHHSGFMHACGHDVHITVLLGLIQAIKLNKPPKNLLFLFQPAEEGRGGAQSVLSEGIIQGYEISSAIALHVASELPVGTISSKSGIFFGIPQEFDVHFKGKSSHVAYPEKGINALQAGLNFLNLMHNEVEELSKHERIIFHVGKMSAGVIRNVIPADCLLEGTHRSLKSDVRDSLNHMIKQNAGIAAAEINAEASVDYLCSYDPVINNQDLVFELMDKCQELNLNYLEAETAMTGEDFGFFTTLYPGLLFWLGSGCIYPLHSDKFLPSDECIEVGIKTMLSLA